MEQALQKTHTHQKQACIHCHEPVVTPFKDSAGHLFCCSGCMHVYTIINGHGLGEFYQIQEDTGEYTQSINEVSHKNFDYLDDKHIEKKYAFYQNNHKVIRFYLEGIHCLACIWLIEKLPGVLEFVKEARLNIEQSVVTITLDHGGKCSKVAATLNSLGYTPSPISDDFDLQKLAKKEERTNLLRIGIAGACAMNIMLYTLGIYAGAENYYSLLFSHLSLLLTLPVITFCAWPFYKSALSGLRHKRLNLDVPLSFALITGFTLSVGYTGVGSDINYYDSISTLVLLILLSRYLLRKAHQNSLKATNLSSLFSRGNIIRIKGGTHKEIEESQLNVGDIIVISPNDYLCADGIVVEGNSSVNVSSLTGESKLDKVTVGSKVFKGSVNHGSEFIIKVTATGKKTLLGSILANVDHNLKTRPHLVKITDHISRYFIISVLSLFAISLIFFTFTLGLNAALQRSLALIIVTCPCALGLATPLAFSRALKKAASLGIIIKNDDTIEKLSKVRHLFFDKTGTLTYGKFEVGSFHTHNQSKNQLPIDDIVFSLEKDSEHPVAKSIIRYLSSNAKRPIESIEWDERQEILGQGISAHYNGDHYTISTHQDSCHHDKLNVVVKENDLILATIELYDQLRSDTQSILSWLHNKKYGINILSGDTTQRVHQLCRQLKIPFTHMKGDMAPQDKASFIDNYKKTLMIGDGANDSVAFSKSDVSIAVQGSVEVSLKVSDIYFSQKGLHPLKNVLTLAKESIYVIKRNLLLSIVYNLAGAVFALGGLIGPLEAAILMPVSSLTVLVSTLWGTRKLRQLQRSPYGSY